MAEINPILNSVQVKDRFDNVTKQKPQGDPFNITGQMPEAIKPAAQNAESKQSMQQQQNNMLMELSKEILKPLQEKTDIQTSQLRDLVAASKILAFSSDKISDNLLKKLFINPGELQKMLLQNDKGQTSFSGEAFDILRMLAKLNLKQPLPQSMRAGRGAQMPGSVAGQGMQGAGAQNTQNAQGMGQMANANAQTNAQGVQGGMTGAEAQGMQGAGAQNAQNAQGTGQVANANAQTNAQGVQGGMTGAEGQGMQGAGAQNAQNAQGMGQVANANAQTNAQGVQGGMAGGEAQGMQGAGAQNAQNAQGMGQVANANAQTNAQGLQGGLLDIEVGPSGVQGSGAGEVMDMQALARQESAENIGKALIEDMRSGVLSSNTREPLQNAVVNILRHFDCYANQDNSLKAILHQLNDLKGNIFTADREVLQGFINKLENYLAKTSGKADATGLTTSPQAKLQAEVKNQDILQLDRNQIDQTNKFLKNDLVPMLSKLVNKYQQATNVREPVVSIIHYVARYDKADPARLALAVDNMSDNLRSISTLTEGDINELKNLIFNAAKEIRVEQKAAGMEKEFFAQYGFNIDDNDMASLLSKAMEDDAPARLQKLAFNLLGSMLDNESPVMPLMHYMIPVEYNGSETYLEMYIDKDCEGRRGNSDSAVNIFFTIESDDYGTFEVDLLARDKMIDLDINAPTELQKEVRQAKDKIRESVEDLGYRLAGYKVNVFRESKAAEKIFPRLKEQKTGMDLKV